MGTAHLPERCGTQASLANGDTFSTPVSACLYAVTEFSVLPTSLLNGGLMSVYLPGHAKAH